jgi:hypothetical protein
MLLAGLGTEACGSTERLLVFEVGRTKAVPTPDPKS